LRMLERQGIARKVHAGAVNARGRSYEPPFLLRGRSNPDEKRGIGALAAQLVIDGYSIALDVGTTTIEVARNLLSRHNLTIVTPSIHIANMLLNQPNIRLILTGGIVRPGEASLTGDLAGKAFEGFRVDQLFLAVGGIDAEAGLTEYSWDDAIVKQAMIRSAKQVIVVADASKFGKVAFAVVAPLKSIHALVTDKEPPAALASKLREANVAVLIASRTDVQSSREKAEKR